MNRHLLLAAAACAAAIGLAACSSPAAARVQPGRIPASTAPATPMATSSGPGSVVMPAFGKNAHVIMTDWMPQDAGMAKAVLADKDYELAFLYAEYTGGKSQDWTSYVSHTMALQVRALLAKPDVTTESFKGTIRIFNMRVIRDPDRPGGPGRLGLLRQREGRQHEPEHGGGPAGPVAVERQLLPLHRPAGPVPDRPVAGDLELSDRLLPAG